MRRRLSLTRPCDVVARWTRAATSSLSMAARTNASFSCSAGERVAMGVEWREGRLLELALTERDREADEVGEAMGAAASRGWLDDVANVCLAGAEERAGDGEWRDRASPDGCFFVEGVNCLHGGLLRAGRLRRRQVCPCERRASVALRAEELGTPPSIIHCRRHVNLNLNTPPAPAIHLRCRP